MDLTIYYLPNINGKWQAISIEYTYGTYLGRGDIPGELFFPANDPSGAKAKLKDWAGDNDRLLSEHLANANISFINAE